MDRTRSGSAPIASNRCSRKGVCALWLRQTIETSTI